MSGLYYRPIPLTDVALDGLPLAGGPVRFQEAEVLTRDSRQGVIPASEIPSETLGRLTTPRAPMGPITWEHPRLMGVLNVTPDSFSDGGRYLDDQQALTHAAALCDAGADIIDIGGESTRPGAVDVPLEEELRRVASVVEGVAAAHPVSIDTRKADVARVALDAGAVLFNDVSALQYDPDSLATAAASGAHVCLMHAAGDPRTMQDDPRYANVLLDVYDFLADRIAECKAAGIPRERILIDPGIGFGKTPAHNLTLLCGISLLHGLGCPILLGVSRKGFIGRISGESDAKRRAPGSIAVALDSLRQGVQMLRVHDIAETKQAVALWCAMLTGQDGAE